MRASAVGTKKIGCESIARLNFRHIFTDVIPFRGKHLDVEHVYVLRAKKR
jgi:hypothetical protein